MCSPPACTAPLPLWYAHHEGFSQMTVSNIKEPKKSKRDKTIDAQFSVSSPTYWKKLWCKSHRSPINAVEASSWLPPSRPHCSLIHLPSLHPKSQIYDFTPDMKQTVLKLWSKLRSKGGFMSRLDIWKFWHMHQMYLSWLVYFYFSERAL